MNVEHITKHPEAIPTLARWHFDQWAHLYPDDTLESFTEDLRESLQGEAVPSTWVLVDERGVWGSASVIEQDMTTNQELGPWLASVYVHSDLRGQRLGQLLVKTVMEESAKAGLKELYLFTPGQEYFYQTLGWQTLKHEPYQGQDVAIMRVDLI
ncbi:GNAT family N-acetyltransferase [Pseudomaricurvus sp.]|uniref:GNAT family N-acetyltransferase n=1 Tax=Pseudomaricurvus sp. TaxID=2004510 RepID=UPI003F6C7DE0